MAGSVMAATPITVTQNTTASQFTTIQTQSRNGVGTSTFAGTSTVVGPTLVPISRFDTTTGILVGARMSVNIPITLALTARGNVPTSGNNRRVNVGSTVSGTVALAGASVTSTSFAVTERCDNDACLVPTAGNTTSSARTLSGSTAVSAANLALLAGAGPGTVNFTTSVNATNTQIVNRSNVITGFADTRFTVGGTTAANNQYSVAYDYLNFANPSFSTGSTVTSSSLNFGTLLVNSGPALLNFTITNIGNINSAGLSLTSISRSTNNSQLTSTITTFSNGLDGGLSNTYSMTFDPLAVGAVNDIFTFNFIDFAPAGSVGARSYQLNLAVSGNVFDPVPEPASWMFMLLGFGLAGAVARRRAVGQPG
ncbi:PEPxxWA-CTERM sorting domain-containing protein [Sandarakinorhabdus limnophila]|uniref:PEPxxWA-CTERM sorting domain-containing protein n=1 Tax=Sandarakinorhabdus limnophila TaxID=210512 RepID=UPI0026EF15B7|nr:PEPxxWA-CTERM sorting domain-containing protein [Sandarakinorhabdus limnophila]MCM0032944.1 PEPxxWA-CTERM sorting domain-containing protein [Sandarakinorhabdus limnophila]